MRDLLEGPVADVAPRLLGATVVSDIGAERVAVRLVEVEAYGGADDPASHAFRGKTGRNAAMFAAPGTAYVYLTYGMHWCLNVAVGPVGEGSAVLLRAGAVVEGLRCAQLRRTSPAGRVPGARDCARGPARLAQTLGVTGQQDRADLLDPDSGLRLVDPDEAVGDVAAGPRVGIRHAAQRPWRFWIVGSPEVSAYRDGRGRRPKGGG